MAIERLIDLIIKILFITITNSLTKNCVLCQLDLHWNVNLKQTKLVLTVL
jgi:hypothetical protein